MVNIKLGHGGQGLYRKEKEEMMAVVSIGASAAGGWPKREEFKADNACMKGRPMVAGQTQLEKEERKMTRGCVMECSSKWSVNASGEGEGVCRCEDYQRRVRLTIGKKDKWRENKRDEKNRERREI